MILKWTLDARVALAGQLAVLDRSRAAFSQSCCFDLLMLI